MVKGFKVTSDDLLTVRQINQALLKLPKDMKFSISNKFPLEVDIVPATDKVKLAMYKDKLTGVHGGIVKKQYLNILIPFFRRYVRYINKMEVLVYD